MGKSWRAGSSKNHAVTESNTILAGLWTDYAQMGTWERVAENRGVTRAMAFRVAHGHIPKRSGIRQALGLPALQAVAICPVHGVVHLKRCPGRNKEQDYDTWRAENLNLIEAILLEI